MKALGWLLALALVPFASAQQESNAIILIPHDAVSRAINPDAYNHDLWIWWPAASNPNGNNRLLSLVTGLDWSAPSTDLAFTQQTSQIFSSEGFERLRANGILSARKALMGSSRTEVLRDPRGFASADSLLLGLAESRQVRTLAFSSAVLPGALAVYSALTWDDAEDLAHRCTGRTLIIEYPPLPGEQLSAAWLQGIKGVPVFKSTGVRGLIPATEAFKLLVNPATFEWRNGDDAESPQKWMGAITTRKPIELSIVFLLTALAALAGLWSIAAENGNKFTRVGIALALGLLPSLLISGNAAQFTGLRAWDGLPFLAFFSLVMAFVPLHCLLRIIWPGSHPLFPLALYATAIALVADPLRTVLSSVFATQSQPISPISAGVLIAALTSSVALSLGGGFWCRVLAVIPAFVLLFAGNFGHPWWSAYPGTGMAAILAVLAGAGAMQIYYLPIFALWPFLIKPWNGRLAYNVGGLLVKGSDIHAINAAAHAEFLLSPAWLSLLAAVVLAVLFGTRYMRHQIRRAFLAKPESRALFWAALSTSAMGFREPFFLTSALIVLIAAFLVLLFDAAGTL